MTITPTPDQLSLTQHILEVVSRLPGDLRGIIWRDDGVTFELSREQYARQCHVDTLRGEITLTYAELLTQTEPDIDLDGNPRPPDWDHWAVDRLMARRWDEDLEAKRRAKQAKPLSR